MNNQPTCDKCGWNHHDDLKCDGTGLKIPLIGREAEPAENGSILCCECGGSHEPSGARSDCILHWKRRAIESENQVLATKCFGVPMLNWLLENLHLLDVDVDAGYCDEQNKPSANFRSLHYARGGRPWTAKGEQIARLKSAIEREMNHVHDWQPVTRYPGGWQDVCVSCGEHRRVEE